MGLGTLNNHLRGLLLPQNARSPPIMHLRRAKWDEVGLDQTGPQLAPATSTEIEEGKKETAPWGSKVQLNGLGTPNNCLQGPLMTSVDPRPTSIDP